MSQYINLGYCMDTYIYVSNTKWAQWIVYIYVHKIIIYS